MHKPIVGYIRVSTGKQAKSGLGLEAQNAAIQSFARERGTTPLRIYREVETGKRSDRPELHKAIQHAKRSKATLVIAVLDRLARNVAFTAALMESGVDFVCCDMPYANKLTIHILAAVAEDESQRISRRTREALQQYRIAHRTPRGVFDKNNSHRTPRGKNDKNISGRMPRGKNDKNTGGLLGAALHGVTLTREAARKGGRKSAALRSKRAMEEIADLLPLISSLRDSGLSQFAIARSLNAEGHTTRSGGPWTQVAVHRVLKRLEK